MKNPELLESKHKKHMRKKGHKKKVNLARRKLQTGKNVWVCLAFYEVAQGGPRGGDIPPPPPTWLRDQILPITVVVKSNSKQVLQHCHRVKPTRSSGEEKTDLSYLLFKTFCKKSAMLLHIFVLLWDFKY